MDDKLIIRKAKPKDAKNILDYLEKTSAQSDFLSFKPGELKISVKEEINYINALNKPNCIFLIAEVAEEIVGKITLTGGKTSRIKHVAELSISVDKAYWGKGVSSELIKQALDWARKTGVITKISLKVNQNNPAAIKLYKKMGFQKEGRLKNDLKINTKYIDSILMGKMIK